MANNDSIGFEEKLWLAADKMRNNLDPAELSTQFRQSRELEKRIKKNLSSIGFEI